MNNPINEKLYLYDYTGAQVEFLSMSDLPNIRKIDIDVLSGDEVATVYYKDGTENEIDSSNTRCIDFFDYSYVLYSVEDNINRIAEFMCRNDSYAMS